MKTNKIIVKYLGQPFILTHRAMECLILTALGFPKKHIANRLGISYRTAEKHITNAKNKIGIHKPGQLLDFLFSSQIRNYVSSSIITAANIASTSNQIILNKRKR